MKRKFKQFKQQFLQHNTNKMYNHLSPELTEYKNYNHLWPYLTVYKKYNHLSP